MADHGTFYWNELMTRDAEKAKAFYAATLNWTFEAMASANRLLAPNPAPEQVVDRDLAGP
jgi:predicted enzyme related to lactoylglutathione lyase